MIRTLLVPLDGSPVAEAILPYVQAFAHLTRARITLLHVTDPLAGLAEFLPEQASEQARDDSAGQPYLAEVAARLAASGLTTDQRLAVGQPADVIIEVGQAYDLIAMSTHGRSGISRWVYGSVADKVLRAATVPVLLFRAREDGATVARPPQRILVPLDGSELSEHALPLAVSLARQARAEIILIRSTVWIRELTHGRVSKASAADLIRRFDERAREYLTAVSQRPALTGIAVRTELSPLEEAEAILGTAEQEAVDLIVMSTHGRGGLGRWVLGSVTGRVLQQSPIPVLLVRAAVPVAYDAAAPDTSTVV